MQKFNALNDDSLSMVNGGKYDSETFVTPEGIELPFVPEYPTVKCPHCGRTGLSAMSDMVGGHLATMYCNQNCLSMYYVDELGNLVHCGYYKG